MITTLAFFNFYTLTLTLHYPHSHKLKKEKSTIEQIETRILVESVNQHLIFILQKLINRFILGNSTMCVHFFTFFHKHISTHVILLFSQTKKKKNEKMRKKRGNVGKDSRKRKPDQ